MIDPLLFPVASACFLGGLAVGFNNGKKAGYRQAIADPPHVHEWEAWRDVPIDVQKTWNGMPMGEKRAADGQERRCKTCRIAQLRLVGRADEEL